MTMEFNAYGVRDRQHAAQIMARCEEAGLSLAECRQAVVPSADAVPSQVAVGRQEAISSCPKCGRGTLRRLAEIEGLRRVGCVACKYSKVVV